MAREGKDERAKLRKGALVRLPMAQLSQLASVVLAMIAAVLMNVVSTRHFTRWDWTANKRYSLTPATIQTLHDLPEPIHVWGSWDRAIHSSRA